MKFKSGYKILLLTVFVISTLFFLNPARYEAIPMYVFAVSGIPVSIKVPCAIEADTRVSEKFSVPPDFDRKSINSLRGFWHFSFYKQCLFRDGYDFEGEKITASEITRDGLYTNHWSGFSLSIPSEASIITDNETDYEIDDRLYTSVIKSGEDTVQINFYTKYDFENLNDMFLSTNAFTNTDGIVLEKELLESGNGFRLKMNTYEGYVFMDGEKVVQIYTDNVDVDSFQTISESFEFTSK